MDEDRRGILFPERLPRFHRVPPAAEAAHAVRWFWIPEWDLPDGTASRQEILPFPACNLVVEPEGVTAVGPPTRRSERVLRGRGWAVGALLRPAAVPALLPEPARLRDAAAPVPAPELLAEVRARMEADAPGAERRAGTADALARWIAERVPPVTPGSEAALAEALVALLADPGITRVDQLPPRLHVSARTVQRVAERFVGLSPHSMIRRRRLQEGAARLREDPGLGIAALAGELGYADHAHFTSDFTSMLGMPPSEYRRAAAPGPPARSGGRPEV